MVDVSVPQNTNVGFIAFDRDFIIHHVHAIPIEKRFCVTDRLSQGRHFVDICLVRSGRVRNGWSSDDCDHSAEKQCSQYDCGDLPRVHRHKAVLRKSVVTDNERFLRHRFSPKPTSIATPNSLPKRTRVAKEAVSAARQTKTRQRSEQFRNPNDAPKTKPRPCVKTMLCGPTRWRQRDDGETQ